MRGAKPADSLVAAILEITLGFQGIAAIIIAYGGVIDPVGSPFSRRNVRPRGMHLSMGDGEKYGTGVEIAGEMTVRFALLKGKQG